MNDDVEDKGFHSNLTIDKLRSGESLMIAKSDSFKIIESSMGCPVDCAVIDSDPINFILGVGSKFSLK